MNRLILIFALLPTPLLAATYTAASCSEANVQSAYATEQASKADGDIIAIPTCTSTTWSSSWTISPTNSLSFLGGSTTTGTCAPGGSCSHTDNTNITLNGGGLNVTIASGKTFRWSGTSITMSGSAQYGALTFEGPGTLRVDHNYFNDDSGGDHTLEPTDLGPSVIDHNYFDSTAGELVNFIQAANLGSDVEGNATWTIADNFGTSGSGWLYIENNYFQSGQFAFDCDYGARLAFRFNIAWYTIRLQTHGVGSGAQRRGCRDAEIYENTFTFSNSPNTNSFSFLVDYESGPMMFWGNTVTGFVTMLREQEVRADNATYSQTGTPNGWGYCGTAYNGTGSNWDQNSNTSSGYACLDQVGRGAGQLLTGSFPSLVNNVTGTIAWPNQALVPTYSWMNTQNTNSYATNHFWQTYESPARVTENTDYYNQYPNVDNGGSFTGAAGTGYGTRASRPSTCTTGVAYWSTDQGSWNQSGSGGQGVLDVCTSTNTWTNGAYTPYTYPDPLEGGSSPAPAAPQNLFGVVL